MGPDVNINDGGRRTGSEISKNKGSLV